MTSAKEPKKLIPIPDSKFDFVRVSSSVLMKIAKHPVDSINEMSWGQITGVKMENYLEVVDCNPLLRQSLKGTKNKHEEIVDQTNNKLNLDTNVIGWIPNYSKARDLATSIFLVYDHVEALSGGYCPFRIFKISEKWMEAAFKVDEFINFNEELLAAKRASLKDIPLYHEIPLRITVNPLTRLFLLQNERKIRPESIKPSEYSPDRNITENASDLNDALFAVEGLSMTVNNPHKLSKKTAHSEFYCSVQKCLSFAERLKDDSDFSLKGLEFLEHYTTAENKAEC